MELRYFKLINKAIKGLASLHRSALVRDRALSRKFIRISTSVASVPTASNSYYTAFNKPHVHLESSGIDRIEPDGIVRVMGPND